jgi:hypothetical protein
VSGDLDDKWAIHLSGSSEDVQKLLAQLSGDDFRLVPNGSNYYVEGLLPARSGSNPRAEWIVSDLVHLLNAAAHLCFGPFYRINLAAGPDQAEAVRLDPQDVSLENVSLQEIVHVAGERELFRKAVRSFSAGGPDGLFEAFEALSYELIRSGVSDYTRDIGTKEWMVSQGWATATEIDSFLSTVVYCRRGGEDGPEEAMSPGDAEALMRRLLLKFAWYCSNDESMRTAS